MKKLFKNFAVFSVLMFAPFVANAALDMDGSASVNVTSDTSATAKTMAFNEARRQIINDVLSDYADDSAFSALMKKSSDSQLSNLISATNIDSERLSATTYSANIKMTVDGTAAKKWLDDNGVRNWLGGDTSNTLQSTAAIELSGGLRDLISLNRALRNAGVNISIKRISGTQLVVGVPDTRQSSFVAAVRGAGWNTSNSDGYIRVWKY